MSEEDSPDRLTLPNYVWTTNVDQQAVPNLFVSAVTFDIGDSMNYNNNM